MNIRIDSLSGPSESERQRIRRILQRYNLAHFETTDERDLTIVARDDALPAGGPLPLEPETAEDGLAGHAGDSDRDGDSDRADDDGDGETPDADDSGLGRIIGGIYGTMFGQWLEIDALAIDPAHRRQHLGEQLLKQAEDTARAHGCRHCLLYTFGFQGKDYYPRFGYREVFHIEGYPITGTEHWFVKDL
ncbi:GNAT family N-acetyltransferase [Bifidobacterium thermophilum]|uniref:GNAT family N-acetyltransferase n=1 Tax=Bifidobacterium thermophilum TaxID=33905 RepID=UPI0030B78324